MLPFMFTLTHGGQDPFDIVIAGCCKNRNVLFGGNADSGRPDYSRETKLFALLSRDNIFELFGISLPGMTHITTSIPILPPK